MRHLENYVNGRGKNLLNGGFQGQFKIGLCFAHLKTVCEAWAFLCVQICVF